MVMAAEAYLDSLTDLRSCESLAIAPGSLGLLTGRQPLKDPSCWQTSIASSQSSAHSPSQSPKKSL